MDLLKLFTREEPIAGLEINDSYLRLVLLDTVKAKGKEEKKIDGKKGGKDKKNEKEKTEILVKEIMEKPLAGGIVAGGRLKDKDKFIEALKGLIKEVKTPIRYAVVSIPEHDIFLKLYPFPKTIGEERLKEAMKAVVDLQLPRKGENFYVDWERRTGGGNPALLAALEKGIADEYAAAVLAAGVRPVSVEFHGLSAVRALKEETGGAVMLLSFCKDSVSAAAAENKIINFRRSLPLAFFAEKGALAVELRKIADFYESEKKKKISGVILINLHTYAIGEGDVIKGLNIPVLPAKTYDLFSLNAEIKKNEGKWLIALGAALRGIMPRSEDALISLMPVGTEEAYENQKAIAFSEFISNAAIGLSVFFVAVFFAGWILMITLSRNFNERLGLLNSLPLAGDAVELEAKAAAFNSLITKVNPLMDNIWKWSGLLADLRGRVSSGINIINLSLPSPTDRLSIGGVAFNRNQLNVFKKSFEESPLLAEVALPLTNLAQKENIPFTVYFRLK